MVYIDTSKPDRELRTGVDLWEVAECAVKRASTSGANMLALKLSRVSEPSDCMYDNIMLEGGGWPIGKQKLAAFLDPGFKGDLDPISLVGVRVWAETGINEHKGKQRLAVIIEGLKHGGYQRAEDPPPGKSVPEPVVESAPDDFVDGEDVPF